MCSMEQRQAAIETYIRSGHGSADTIAELGHPSGTMPGKWRKECGRAGMVPERRPRAPASSAGQMHAAASCCLEHGRGLSGTGRAMGCPEPDAAPAEWAGGLAPGKREVSGARISRRAVPIAERHGAARAVPHAWRREILGSTEGGSVRSGCDSLPDGPEGLGKRTGG